jgi:2-polyprenyl-3-methyl-5-hydroxy-6-metoxy-1,4-benzoquinol methylase
MNLIDRLHCPECHGRLATASASTLQCTDCERTIRIVDGTVDFAGDSPVPATNENRYGGDLHSDDARSDALLSRIKAVSGEHWPTALGDVVEFGCGYGQLTRALAAENSFRSMLVLDSSIDMVRTARQRIAALGIAAERPALYATLSMDRNAIRDAVADTVIGTALLAGIGDTRAFLRMVQRILKPNGRAFFIVPNRRYRQALCQATAEALVQRFAREGVWPEGNLTTLSFLAHTRRLLVHPGDMVLASDQKEKHLFDSDALEDLGREAGFASAAMIPLDPDQAGAETARGLYAAAGVPDDAARVLAPLTASAGQPFFSLLNRQDQSSAMLLWLTKASGPEVRIFTARPPPPAPTGQAAPEAALGGAPPRWSIELLARDTPGGIVVAVGGWCLINSDVLWLRLTLGGVARVAPVWRPRPDVHEVLNRGHHYHPLNALCSGLDSDLEFAGVHAVGNACRFSLDIQLSNGVVVSGPMPERLVMHEQTVIAH